MSKKEVDISLRKSFLAKYIQSDDRVKKVYTILKNKLLSIDKMKSRISWFYDAFNIGRLNFAKLSVRGKYVALYLNLDCKDYPENIYHQEYVGDRRRYSDTSFKIHCKSDRTIKYAFRLIDDEIKKFNLKTHDIPKENYYLQYEEDEPLIKRGLISTSGKITNYTYDPKDFIYSDSLEKTEEIYETDKKKQVIFVSDSKVFIKSKKSFEAKLIQSSTKTQEYYSILKNQLLSFTKVRSKVSWKYDAFSAGRQKLAKLSFRGQNLFLFLNLDLKKYPKDKMIRDYSKYDLFKDTPLAIRVNTDESLERAKELVYDLKKRFLLEEGFIKENHEYSYEFLSNDNLVDQGLIKVFAKFGDYKDPITKEMGEELEKKKKNAFTVYRETKQYVLSIDDLLGFVEKEEIVRTPVEGEKDIVYLDVLESFYNDGDTITLEDLKKKKILKYDIDLYKVLYRGGNLNKKLIIKAQAISPVALKVLEDAGGEYIFDLGE